LQHFRGDLTEMKNKILDEKLRRNIIESSISVNSNDGVLKKYSRQNVLMFLSFAELHS